MMKKEIDTQIKSKIMAFGFALFLLFAGNAAAQENTKVFYFYPPEDRLWIAGRSYLYDGTNKTQMEIAPNMCGWYRVVYFNTEPPENVEVWLGQNGTDKIGINGRLATDLDEGADVGHIPLKQLFEDLNDTLYFVAGDGYTEGMYTADPAISDNSRCSYNLATFIYDTDPSVHPDFSCNENNCIETPTNTNNKSSCNGVIPGLVKSTLNPDTKKIEYSGTDPNNCWTNEDWFNKAFTNTLGVNVAHCYDMPFERVTNGNYEFDSDKLLNTNGRLVGGFYPELLNNAAIDPDCPSCNTKRAAEVFTPIDLTKGFTVNDFDRYNSKPGDFKDGNTPDASAINNGLGATSVWDWGKRDTLTWYLYGNTAIKGNAKGLANQHFCFESHANFIYSPEQEFFFRGDDDIWVYINNELVVDLGGTHLAAPGHVKLNTLGLTEGTEYPIDIFFCDRRSPASNIRISANIYATQRSAVYINPAAENQRICVAITSGDDCSVKMGLDKSTELCGEDLTNDPNYEVEYFMVPRGSKDTLWLDPNDNADCIDGADDFSCYNGIRIFNGGGSYSCGGWGQCRDNPDAMATINLAGNFNVYARVLQGGVPITGSRSINIDGFKVDGEVPIIPQITDGNHLITPIYNGINLVANNNAIVSVYNLSGKLERTLNFSAGNYTVRLGDLPKGMYIIKATHGNEKQIIRLAVK